MKRPFRRKPRRANQIEIVQTLSPGFLDQTLWSREAVENVLGREAYEAALKTYKERRHA